MRQKDNLTHNEQFNLLAECFKTHLVISKLERDKNTISDKSKSKNHKGWFSNSMAQTNLSHIQMLSDTSAAVDFCRH